MYKKISLPLLALVCMTSQARTKRAPLRSPFAHMDAMMEQMQKNMAQMSKSFDALWEQHQDDSADGLSLLIDENKQGNAIVVTASGIEAENINATVNDDQDVLTVKTDNAQLIIYTKDKYISVDLTEQTEESKEQKNKKGEKQRIMHHVASKRSSFGRTVPHEITLGDPYPQVDYDKKTKDLTITLSYTKHDAKKGTSIPVNITQENTLDIKE